MTMTRPETASRTARGTETGAEAEHEHEHWPMPFGRDGAHQHLRCEECGHLLCATSTSTREQVQVRDATGTLVAVRTHLRRVQTVVGDGPQRRTVLITTEQCGPTTVTTVEATPWQ